LDGQTVLDIQVGHHVYGLMNEAAQRLETAASMIRQLALNKPMSEYADPFQ
jgi:hypothetical protein